ncbi:NAD-capped RNA hydrolase NUDT12 (DeNADding enzyme NUDT12) (NADH pyrophosphatase NUDT12) (Nucleoside diphosphate-linked moiety X motif 12) (Nudix motif 12) [Durusdinium trenchii]|uniref:NAD-capped RNA hydrolase NUDT12 (DeNADding enzyme NUDT12) (NADH pyrophosphatase NUDT12) (Nucleoside diphosphate-linked moiety X motif 12) (Nudix motif 12) n=1 Tax=Durusdinium trenchii TaxID=1381693 RepID=A0ABP0I7K5_9DINO
MLSYRTYNSEDHRHRVLIDSKWYRCRQGHELRTLGLPYLGVTCSLCGRVLPPGSCLHSCPLCSWDACTDCLQRPDSARSLQLLPDCPICGDPMEWSDYRGGHYTNGWACNNKCGSRRLNSGLWRWFCLKCGADVCDQCHRHKVHREREGGLRESPRSLEIGVQFLELCKDHQWEKVKKILSERPNLVNCEVEGRWSALHYAARAGHPQMVQFLLDLSADATSFAGDGKTPLEVAKEHDIRSLLMRSSFLQPAMTIFEHYDAEGTGAIDGMELGWVIKSVQPELSDAEVQEMFASCDTNHNGEIDFIEFVMWLFAGRGKTFAQDILASAKNLSSSSGVGKRAMQLKAVLAARAGLDPSVYTNPDFASMPKMAHHPPRDPHRVFDNKCLALVDETMKEVQRIADQRNESSQGIEMQHPEMVCAIVMWTFDPVLITGDQTYPKEQTFQHLVNRLVDQRDTEFFYASRGFFYYFMTALDKLPPASGMVYQGIPRKDVTAAREALVEGTTVTWRSFTTALQLWGNMIPYERGLVLQITLLPPELRAKGMRFESKGRDISKLSAFSGSCEVLLMPNMRMHVGPEVQKKGIAVIELTELEEEPWLS